MSNTNNYIKELIKIAKIRDIPQNYVNEILEVLEDIIQENDLQKYEMISTELGSPEQFLTKYFENRSFKANDTSKPVEISITADSEKEKSISIFTAMKKQIRSIKGFEDFQIRLTNYFTRKKIKLHYFVIPFLGYLFILFLIAINDQKVYGGYGNYFRLPQHVFLSGHIIFLSSLFLGLFFVERMQKEVIEKKTIDFRAFYNVYKIFLLALVILIMLNSAFFVNREVYRQDPYIPSTDQRIGELVVSVCTKCGSSLITRDADFFSFFELSNLNYESIDIDYVQEFLPIINFAAEIRMSDWNGFFRFHVFNESLYKNFAQNRNFEPFDFEDKLYITEPKLFEKLEGEAKLTYSDGSHSTILDFGDFELKSNDFGFYYSRPDDIYLTIEAWNSIFDIPLNQIYKTTVFWEGESYTEYSDLRFILETEEQSKNDTVINSLYNTFNSFFNVTSNDGVYSISPVNPYFVNLTAPSDQSYQYISQIRIGAIVGFFSFLVLMKSQLRTQIESKKSKKDVFRRINLHILGISCISLIIGTIYGFLSFVNTSWIYLGHSLKVSKEFSFLPLLTGFIIHITTQIIVQIGLSEIYLRKLNEDN